MGRLDSRPEEVDLDNLIFSVPAFQCLAPDWTAWPEDEGGGVNPSALPVHVKERATPLQQMMVAMMIRAGHDKRRT
jgi:hypothetical protein